MPIKKTAETQPKANDTAEKSKASPSARLAQSNGACCLEGTTQKKAQPESLPLSSACCMGTTLHSHAPSLPANGKLEAKNGAKTKIVVRYDVGFQNSLTIRGKGANLTWDRGLPLKNIKHDEWVWETDAPFSHGEFKVLINDHHYEAGPNHLLNCGTSVQYTPKF